MPYEQLSRIPQSHGLSCAAKYRNLPAVTDGLLITAGGVSPLEFAYEIFKKLDVFTPAMLEAWFGLFKTGDMKYFGELMKAER